MEPGSFGLIALRRGVVARAFVAVGSLSLIFIYVAPFVRALELSPPPRIHSLHPLTVPAFRFPQLKVPQPYAIPARPVPHAVAPAVGAGSTQTSATRTARRTVHVPVITDERDLRPQTPTATKSHPAAAQPPVITSTVGVEPSNFGVGAVQEQAAAPAATASPAIATGTDPVAAAPATETVVPDPTDAWLRIPASIQVAAPSSTYTTYEVAPPSTPPAPPEPALRSWSDWLPARRYTRHVSDSNTPSRGKPWNSARSGRRTWPPC